MAKAKVLLASANRSELLLMQEALAEFGLSLSTAEDGPAALQLARQQRPHLIVMEMELPGKSGVECCWQLRSQEATRNVPIVLLTTGHSWDNDACLAAGCSETLGKPLERGSFVSLAHKLLGSIERRESRLSCRTLVHCRSPRGNFYGAIEDISSRGMFVATSEELHVGTEVNLRFCLPWPDAVPLKIDAQVAWINRGQRRKRSLLPDGFGVVFRDPPTEAIVWIESYIEYGELLLNAPRRDVSADD